MKLIKNAVHLHFCFPLEIKDSDLLRSYESLLSEEEIHQKSRFFLARDRHRFLVTRVLIRTTLSNYYPVDPADWTFSTNEYGKPRLSFRDFKLPIRFNLSHAGGLILCGAVLGHEIGVDVEDTCRPTSSPYQDLSHYFSEQEVIELKNMPQGQQKHRFFDYWTLKEAYIKARGKGMSIPLDKFGFSFKADKLNGFWIHPDLDDEADGWQFWRIPFEDRYRVAVAINGNNNSFTLSAVNAVPLQSEKSIPLTFL